MGLVVGFFWQIFGGIILFIVAVVLLALLTKAILGADERRAEGRSNMYTEGHIIEELQNPGLIAFGDESKTPKRKKRQMQQPPPQIDPSFI